MGGTYQLKLAAETKTLDNNDPLPAYQARHHLSEVRREVLDVELRPWETMRVLEIIGQENS
jgi:hypothetical protein